jgi:methionine-rich copper-binding protein CopC
MACARMGTHVLNPRRPEEQGLILRTRAFIAAAASLAVLVLLASVRVASAHAVLLEASPAANSKVKGPDVAIRLRYNVRVEASRCRLSLLLPDKSVKSISVTQPSADTLAAQAAGIPAGEYRLRWQVLASDGHITRGEVPFSVVP